MVGDQRLTTLGFLHRAILSRGRRIALSGESGLGSVAISFRRPPRVLDTVIAA